MASSKGPKGFNAVKNSIAKKENISEERAAKIAAAAGRKNLGQKEMTRRSVAARRGK